MHALQHSFTVHPIEFSRILSNLLNNAVEAMPGFGMVKVSLSISDNRQVILTIRDTGRGIPDAVFGKLFERGFSHEKPNGNGLGLHHARQFIDQWNGSISLDSKMGEGTTVTATIPWSEPPRWLVPEIQIQAENTIVIVDDDPSVFEMWKQRFANLQSSDRPGLIHYFKTVEEVYEWASSSLDLSKTLFLIDLELSQSSINGVRLIEQLKIERQSAVVTSAFGGRGLQSRCMQIGVKILPKSLVPFIPIAQSDSRVENLDAVLIDDDESIHSLWKLEAKMHGKRVITFFSVDKFLDDASAVDRTIPIFIDSQLSNGERGEDVSLRIADLGFSKIQICTGYTAQQVPMRKWISAIRGKEPPWGEGNAIGE